MIITLNCHQNKGEFGKLDIYRFCGKMKRKQDWRTQDFQIKNGSLKYFKSNRVSAINMSILKHLLNLWGIIFIQMDRPHNELDLSLVVCVSACPAHDNTSAFHFEIHFSATKGSPWLLRAQSEVCKLHCRSVNDSYCILHNMHDD